jgi:hypothetical protein
MRILLILVIALLSLACGGGGTGNTDFWGLNKEEENVSYINAFSGNTEANIDDQMTIIRSAEDFNFNYRLLTGEQHHNPNSVIDHHDVLMIIHTRTDTDNEINVSSITEKDDVLNVYYFHNGDSNVEQKDYKLYYIPKKSSNPRFIRL